MPPSFPGSGSPAPEATAAEYAAALGRLAHRWRGAALAVEGPERVAFLQGQLTQDVQGLGPGESRPAAGLTPKGKLLYVGRIVGEAERILLLIPARLRSVALAHLSKYAAFQRVAVRDVSEELARVGLYGPEGARLEAPPQALRLSGDGEFSGEILAAASLKPALEEALARSGSLPVGNAASEILRVEAGRPSFGQDVGSENLPDEAGLGTVISWTKGCYVGQEIVARRRTYGRIPRRLVGYRFPDGLLSPGAPLRRPESGDSPPRRTEAGRVTSAVSSPRLGPIGLGFAFHDVAFGDRLVSSEDPGRGAVASALPFA